jgi:uncharacterized membrane protein/sporulation protein YlmC with PRC-barrel domain
MDFPLDAAVDCVDGPCGQSTTIIVDPATEKITHIAVRDPERAHTQYLVPLEAVDSTTADSIQLNCTRDELAQMEPFVHTEYVEAWMPNYADDLGVGSGYTGGPEMVAVEHEHIPSGTLAVRPGMSVEATDGYVGTVDELVVEPEGGQITHMVLRKGHLWGATEVRLPVSDIERADEYTIYLKLDTASINAMPIVQARRHYSKKEINAMDIELLIATFDEVGGADQAMDRLKALLKKGVIEIRNMAVLVKEQDGKVSFKETEDVDARHGALFGAITGGLIGLLGGPAGVVLGAAAGAATGRVAADKIDRGFSDEYLETLQNGLQPGSSALVTLVEAASVDKVIGTLADLKGQPVRQKLTDETLSQLTTPTNDG